MALPLIFLPAGIPLPLIGGFGIALGEQFDHVPSLQGEGRKRRMFTTAPRTAQVSWILTEAQMAAFDAWAERDLDVLSRKFTIQLKKLGAGFEYWAAEWLAPYASEPMLTPDRHWKVTGQLLLTGTPADALPSTGELEGVTTVSLSGSGTLSVPNALAGTTIVSLGAFIALQGITEISLGYFLPYDPGGNELRDDDGIEIREDGGNELRE